MNEVYDGAFRTMITDCPGTLFPFVNEAFGENYTGQEKIEFLPNELMTNESEETQKRITDAIFKITAAVEKKYHVECQSTRDGKMLIRMFEYDAKIALGKTDVSKDKMDVYTETLTVTFPHSAVLYLRSTKNTPDVYGYVINTPGGTVSYNLPVIKMKSYTLDQLFDKKLLFLLPFYVFSHEDQLKKYEENPDALEEFKSEYRSMVQRLDELRLDGKISYYDEITIIEISKQVFDEISKKYQNVRKEVDQIMSAPLLETEIRQIRNEALARGEARGIVQGEAKGQIKTLAALVHQGILSVELAAKQMDLSVDQFHEKCDEYLSEENMPDTPQERPRNRVTRKPENRGPRL